MVWDEWTVKLKRPGTHTTEMILVNMVLTFLYIEKWYIIRKNIMPMQNLAYEHMNLLTVTSVFSDQLLYQHLHSYGQ